MNFSKISSFTFNLAYPLFYAWKLVGCADKPQRLMLSLLLMLRCRDDGFDDRLWSQNVVGCNRRPEKCLHMQPETIKRDQSVDLVPVQSGYNKNTSRRYQFSCVVPFNLKLLFPDTHQISIIFQINSVTSWIK